ncbi:MAG TPA: hypothetical protein VEH47_09095 [Candidatus Acidoferrales bacterium]|nr:hypothetical protein [Candidatus Acidoferrales bacterium]
MSATEVIPSTTRVRGVLLMIAAATIYLVLRLAGFHTLFENDAEGVGALVQIIGTLYSVVYAFATYVVWGQFAGVENEILQESGALKDLLLFSKGLKESTRDPIVRAVRGYARGVVESEWGALSNCENTERTDKLFAGIISSVTEAKPADEAERTIHPQLLEIANQASAHRDERLALSAKRIPRTLLLFVTLTAVTILFLLLFYPFHNLALGLVSVAITSMLLFLANFVLTDLDNPFEGTWNVNNRAFDDLATKYR